LLLHEPLGYVKPDAEEARLKPLDILLPFRRPQPRPLLLCLLYRRLRRWLHRLLLLVPARRMGLRYLLLQLFLDRLPLLLDPLPHGLCEVLCQDGLEAVHKVLLQYLT
jgi:hypothetical protein